jgi:hypothetical protein
VSTRERLIEGMIRCCICSRALREVAHMISTTCGIFMCDECVDLAAAIVAEARGAAGPRAEESKK